MTSIVAPAFYVVRSAPSKNVCFYFSVYSLRALEVQQHQEEGGGVNKENAPSPRAVNVDANVASRDVRLSKLSWGCC